MLCDPDILTLRQLDAAMDRAVLDAYGWQDIPTSCEFLLDWEDDDDDDTQAAARRRKKPYRLRWPDEIRDEVLARLLDLNSKRAAEEALVGELGAIAEPRADYHARSRKASSPPTAQQSLDLDGVSASASKERPNG